MISVVTISDKLLLGKRINLLSAYLCESFFKHNFKIAEQFIVSPNSDLNNIFLREKEGDIFVLLVDKASVILNNLLAQKSGCVIVDNAHAKNQIMSVYRDMNIPPLKESENEWKIPAKARSIINPNGMTQGYILQAKGILYLVLPTIYSEARQMFENVALDYIISQQKIKYKNYTFKTFGLSEQSLRLILVDEIKNKEKISINFFEHNLNVDIVLKASEDNKCLDSVAQSVFLKLNNYIYSVEDLPIYKIAYNLLKMNDLKISFCEDITGGQLCNSLLSQAADAKEIISEGIVALNKNSKIKRLGIKESFFENNAETSVETVYEMATKQIVQTGSDLVVVASGGVDGLCYIAVGDKREVHVYKNMFSGTLSDIIESLTVASYFYLIKKLKKNDFHFEQTTI